MIRIMLVSKQDAVLDHLRRMITDEDLEIAAEAPGGDPALEKVENIAPDILIINSGSINTDAFNLAERVIQCKPRTFVILLVDQLTAENLQSANAVGCHNVIPFPTVSKELCDTIRRVYNTETARISALNSNQRVTWSSKVLTVFGAKGGLGKTTIAVNLAIKLAEQRKRVALLDFDLQFGDVSVFMDIEPKDTIAELIQDVPSPSIDSVRSYMTVHPSGVHVLCAPKSPEYADMISADRIQGLLSLLRSYYDFVIIDTGANFSDVTLAAIEASTDVLFVTGLDLSILKNSKVTMSILESLGQKKKVRVIINRAMEINSITIADVQRIVDAPILARVPSDYMVAVAALNRGQPFVLSAPKAKLSLSVADIARRIASGGENFDMQQLSPRERKKLMRKYQTRERAERKSLFGRRS